jgi:hypothetical protein
MGCMSERARGRICCAEVIAWPDCLYMAASEGDRRPKGCVERDCGE